MWTVKKAESKKIEAVKKMKKEKDMKVFAKTDIGRERKINQDFFYISDPESEIKLFILADGMGGYNGGEVASKMATESVCKFINRVLLLMFA